MKKILKHIGFKFTSALLAFLMIFYLLPITVFANETQPTNQSKNETSMNFLSEMKNDVIEITERRDEAEKHFRLSDGTYIAVQYNIPVHYQNEDFEWVDIDNTLNYQCATDSEDFVGYESINEARVKFANNTSSSKTVSIKNGDYKISWGMIDANKGKVAIVTNPEEMVDTDPNVTTYEELSTLTKLVSKVMYADAYDNTDIEYVLLGNTVKENIIIKENGAQRYSYSFEMKLNGLSATLNEDGSITLCDEDTGNIVYTMPAPFMFDANGVHCKDVSYTMEQKNTKYTITVTADAEWINAADRALPVTVDPTVNYGSGSTYTTYSAYVDSTLPDDNFFSENTWYIGQYDMGHEQIGYNKLNAITGIPSSAVITQARLFLCSTWETAESDMVFVYEVTSAWYEDTVTYNTRPTMATTVIDYECGGDIYFSFDVTSLAKKWREDTSSNYGVALTLKNNEYMDVSAGFYKASSSAYKPLYIVSYQDTKGIEDYYNYYGSSADAAGNGYVNAFTGKLSFLHNSLSTTDNLMPYTFGLAYNGHLAGASHTSANTASAYSTAYAGKGFKLYSDESIRDYTLPTGGTEYVWMDADGTEHYFEFWNYNMENEEQNIYVDEDGLKLYLYIPGSMTDNSVAYLIKDDVGNEKAFDSNGYLIYIKDVNGNKRTFNRTNGKLTSVSLTPNGYSTFTQLNFTYNSSNLLQRVSNVQNGMTADFYYSSSYNGTASQSSSGFLRKIIYTYSAGYTHTVTFEYNQEGHLTLAKDLRTQKAVGYTYDSQYRVTRIAEYANATQSSTASQMTAGQSASIGYGTQKTTYSAMGTDNILGSSDDVKTVYQFDHTGKVVSAYSIVGNQLYGASNYVYESEESVKTKNSVSSVLTLGGVAVNYLCDPGFDNITSISSDANWSKFGTVTTPVLGEVANSKTVKLQITSASPTAKIEQTFRLSQGDYTFSALIDPRNLTENARVRLAIYNEANDLVAASNYLYEQDFGDRYESTSVWEQLSVSFAVSNNYCRTYGWRAAIELSYVSGGSGTCSILADSTMLEKSKGTSTFSLLGNGGFEAGSTSATTDWSYTNGAPVSTGMFDGAAAIRLNGDPDALANAKTVLIDSGYMFTPAQSFVVSGWGKANSVQTEYPENNIGDNGKNPVFAIKVVVAYCTITDDGAGDYNVDWDNPREVVHYIPFSDDNVEWQFASGVVNLETNQALKSIEVYACYDYNANTAYFDNFSIVCNTNSVTNYSYNSMGYLQSAYASDGTGTSYVYASNGIDVTDVSTTGSGDYEVETDDKHRTTAVINLNGENGYRTNYTYNGIGKTTVVSTIDIIDDAEIIYSASSYATNNTYFGATLTQTDATGGVTTYSYDGKGRLYSVYDATGNGLVYTYDGFGQLTGVCFAQYDSTEEEMVMPGDGSTVNNAYNANGSLQSITVDSTVYTFTYDAFGNTTNIKVNGQSLASYEYEEKNGVLLSMDYGNGCSVEYLYDGVDRIVGVCYNGSAEARFAYTYNADGNVTKHEDLSNGLEYQYYYDAGGRLTQTTVHKTGSENELFYLYQYQYDDQGRAVERYNYYCTGTNAAPLSYTKYTYDADGSISKVTFNGSSAVSYTKDRFGRIETRKITNSIGSTAYVTQGYSYATHGTYNGYTKTSGEISCVITTDASGIEYTYYTYNEIGYITQIRRANASGTTLEQHNYKYDDLGQLIREDNYLSGSSTNRSYVYTYDKRGNRLSKVTYAYTTGTLGSAISTQNYSYDTTWGELLSSYNGTDITYDAIGNPTIIDDGEVAIHLEWQGRQLMSHWDADADWYVDFTYNENGVRISKNDGGTLHEYMVDGTQIQREIIYYYNSTNVQYDLRYFYDANGIPTMIRATTLTTSGTVSSDVTYYLGTNLQGDVVAIYNSAGTKIYTYAYDAWGNIIQQKQITPGGSTANSLNPFRYRGYYYDVETGWYYLNSRYYHPGTGRFVNGDGVSYLGANGDLQAFNLFIYCSNNPVMEIDACGTCIHNKKLLKLCDKCKDNINRAVKVITDIGVTAVATGFAIIKGVVTTQKTGSIAKGFAAGIAEFSLINNTVNSLYYTFVSDGESSLSSTSYHEGYLTRWDRLDYTKQETGEEVYNLNAWRYNSEYSMHMYGWFATGWAYDKDIPLVSKWAERFFSAGVDPNSWDGRPLVDIATVVMGILGV